MGKLEETLYRDWYTGDNHTVSRCVARTALAHSRRAAAMVNQLKASRDVTALY